MQPNNDAQLQSLWSYLFLSRLHALGLNHVFISPGSRSTPLVQAAECLTNLNKHIILDERSAAYTALGTAKATGKATALICTSGTAVANYYPAVIEARQSGTPLIVLSADRPADERNTGANQTINQIDIYGSYPVLFEDAGDADFSDDGFQHITELAFTSWNAAAHKHGPVHINFPFHKPLESDAKWLSELQSISVLPEALERSSETATLSKDVRNLITTSERVLIIAGPMRFSESTQEIFEALATCNTPVIAEAGSQLCSLPNAIHGADAFLRNSDLISELKPDLIVRLGRQPVSKGINNFLMVFNKVPHLILPHLGYEDNAHKAEYITVLNSPINEISEALQPGNDKWLLTWKRCSEKTLSLVDQFEKKVVTDWHAYQEIIPGLAHDWFIMASNSFPARDLDLASGHLLKNQPVYMNRGASGIDGITSTAIGIALGSQKSGVLFTGDLAFLHDTTALLQAKSISQTLIIIVNNNGGGQIFRMLPFPERDETFTKYFETPQNAHLIHLAKAFGVQYRQARQPGDIGKHFHALKDTSGLHIIECITDPEVSMSRRRTVWSGGSS